MTDETPPIDEFDEPLPGEVEAPVLDEEEYRIAVSDEAVPVVPLDDLPESNPAEDHGDQDDMDDSALEGLGSDGEAIWRRALPRVREKVRDSASNEIGYCLKEVRTVNEAPAKYLDARGSLLAADEKHRVGDWLKVPRGAIVYMDGPEHPHGHVCESMGSGFVGTTDSPLGHWGRVGGADLAANWRYPRAWWSPIVNDVRVGEWTRGGQVVRPEPTEAQVKLRQLVAWRDHLRVRLKDARERRQRDRVRTLVFRLQTVDSVIERLGGK